MPLTMNNVDLECERCGDKVTGARVRTRATAFGEEVVNLGRSSDATQHTVWMRVNGVLVCPGCLTTTAGSSTTS